MNLPTGPRIRNEGGASSRFVSTHMGRKTARGQRFRDLSRRKDEHSGAQTNSYANTAGTASAKSRRTRIRTHGSTCVHGALDVHRAQVFGCCEATTGIEPFGKLVDQIMKQEPYRSADRVFWIVDNGSSHRGAASCLRLQSAWQNTILVHTPVHASWLNQIEIYLSILQRKVLTPNDFQSLDQLRRAILAFQQRYSARAKPFAWCFTRDDLHRLLSKLAHVPVAA